MKATLLPLLLALVFASCAPSTPQARIDREPEKFASLSTTDQGLVQQGLIDQGMPPAAVELAWGPPDRRFEGSKNQQATARWDYTGALPVYSSSLFGSFAPGYGPHYGRGRYANFGYGFGPEVIYVPSRLASVWFIDDKVDGWERAR